MPRKNQPRHYAKYKIQAWDYNLINKVPFGEGCIIKYVSRWDEKGGIVDLFKALDFLRKILEVNGVNVEIKVKGRYAKEARKYTNLSH
jgi:hypothetical protein